MISITSFSNIPEISIFAIKNNINLEFNGLVKPILYSDEFVKSIKERPDYSLIRSAHGPFFDLMPGTDDIELKELVELKLKRAITACKILGIKNIIFHTGWFPKTYEGSAWIKNSLTFWNNIIEFTNNAINIFIENVYEDTPDLMLGLVKEINNNNFNICLDIGHVNANSSKSLKQWIETLQSKIGHVHLHNNFGINDDHNGLTNGNINIKEILTLLKHNSPIANWNLEIRNGIEESIAILQKANL